MNTRLILLALLAILMLGSCKKDGMIQQDTTPLMIEQNGNFPPPNIPADNPITAARSELGRKLFYDKLLSLDQTISCASCHVQGDGFSDICD